MSDGGTDELRTERLMLRRWRDEDLEPFAVLNGDPETMVFFPAPWTRAESDQLVRQIETSFETSGFGLWAVEAPGVAPFLGFVGLWPITMNVPFTGIEIGWRLDKAWWGNGYATEAAKASLAFGFTGMGLDEIVSFTAIANEPSQRVMQRIGMVTDRSEDFDHPRIPEGHPLRRHVLYRISHAQWKATAQ